jgi:YhcH/YjgK/YiaL family protein
LILDKIGSAENYIKLHPAFPKAFHFLRTVNIHSLTTDRIEIAGDLLYASNLVTNVGGDKECRLEVHRKYIDIHYVLSGVDRIGWKWRNDCSDSIGMYDNDKDILFYSDKPDNWIELRPGAFAVFYPEDAHAPLAGSGELHKLIVKIAVDQ